MILIVAFLAFQDTRFFIHYAFYNAKHRLLLYPFILIFCTVLCVTSFVCAIRICLTLFCPMTSPYRKMCKLHTNLGRACSITRLLTCVDLIVVYCIMPAGLFLIMYHVYWILITLITYPLQVGTYLLLVVMIALFAGLLVYCFLMVAYFTYAVCRDAVLHVKNSYVKNTLAGKKYSMREEDKANLELKEIALDMGEDSTNDDGHVFGLAISGSDLELYVAFALLLMWVSGFLSIYYVLFVANALNPEPPSEFIISVILPSAAIPLVTFWFKKEKDNSKSEKENSKKSSTLNQPEKSYERQRSSSLPWDNARYVQVATSSNENSKDRSKKNDSAPAKTM